MLAVPGLIYESLVRARNSLYSRRLLPRRRLSRPVCSVGNLTLGGTGKTPLVIHTAELLLKLGAVPALLSRGYGRNSADPLVVGPREEIAEAALALGDEPALIRRHVPDVWIGISADRYAAGLEILRRNSAPAFILDDGFQHLRLYRDLDLVLLDRTQPLEKNRVLPVGTLREPATGLSRAHAIVIQGAYRENHPDAFLNIVRKLNPRAQVFHCVQDIDSLAPFSSWKDSTRDGTAAPDIGPAYLVAAVGNPERFRRDIVMLGIQVRGARFYRDHHRLTERDWRECEQQARKAGAEVFITTEKDAIKIGRPPQFPLLVSVQRTRVIEADLFARMLRDLAGLCCKTSPKGAMQ
jgi:tetraacyldisaccharide 4'-kinase